ncbi:GNAT family N-acetyltransferase [Actinocrispum wychmicini]|uniref:N-acetylglutamate synthase-like GNAT family acetyltransferase n=1 Tax=Actinocrispum wychmicini TaxID=1213861 RepID=A0A4R2JKP6_9PSEU|nr:GNAT family N-acetyltransferase [Actinocrispum wychmicini]TCO59734.1 N-acetylglutamate synthase-like GNAT family acetyltransferase [Actinocrispum wychmicini]
MRDLTLRAARPDEADALSELTLRSKAHWGYDAAFLAGCRDQLRLRRAEIVERRTVVAEQAGTVVGVATLDGQPPDGELGLLFVEPDAIGGSVGRVLYRHVLAEVGRLGFSRLTIESDPHAEGFYLAMGAERVGVAESGLPVLVAWPVRPEPSWSVVWSAGGQTVLVGNVAEFNGQFAGGVRGPDHYSCLTAFCGPRPAMIVLPEQVGQWWVREVGAVLGWGEVEVHSGVAGDGRVSEAILTRPDLVERLTSQGAPVLPWGRTAVFDPIAPTPDGVLAAISRYESKRHAHALFRDLAGHPGIVVPEQRLVASRRAFARELTGRAVLKKEYGVGGSGTLIVSPETPGLRAVTRRWGGVLLVEEYVEGAGPHRNPTFDAVIGPDGAVHPVGVGLMDIDETSYQGVTVGAVPDSLAATATGFGVAVGEALAAEGYRGWYDVDFVTDRSGRLAPVEINLRLTGPAVAFHIQAGLDRLRGGRHVVRTLDRLLLGARLPEGALRDHLAGIVERCRVLGATLLVTIPTAAFDPVPYLGVAIAARTTQSVDEAETAVRDANAALGEMFGDLPVSPRGARGSRRRPG